MTVQRQYTLPNCNLKLEGLSTGDENDPMAPLTVVLNSECTFPGVSETLSGGREFLNALVETVSNYAQSLLSGIPYPFAETVSANHPVTLKVGENHRHHLIANVADVNGEQTRKALELNSVQLFDLMEAVDQLLADTLTLPDLKLQLSPLERRHARPAESATKRVVPAAVGLSTLTVSAALLFMVPVPRFEPRPTEEDQNLSEQVEESASTPITIESAPPAEDSLSRTAEEDVGDDAIEDSDEDAAEIESVDPVEAGIALGRLSTAPEITDADALADLEDDLEATLEEALSEEISFEDSLVYRVAVSESGDILGYKYENDAALTSIDDTPLPKLTFIPVDEAAAIEEPIAQFRITFDPDGEISVEPLTTDTDEEDE